MQLAMSVILGHALPDPALFDIVREPDSFTGGQILGTTDSRSIYLSGRGRVIVSVCVHQEVIST